MTDAICRCTEYATCEACISRPRVPLFGAYMTTCETPAAGDVVEWTQCRADGTKRVRGTVGRIEGDRVYIVDSTVDLRGVLLTLISRAAPNTPPMASPTATRIAAECDALKAMLLAKNAAYGDSATDPVRVFSGSSPSEQIRVRIDDKISRLSRGHAMADESMRDTVRDLIGYLVLLLIVEES